MIRQRDDDINSLRNANKLAEGKIADAIERIRSIEDQIKESDVI